MIIGLTGTKSSGKGIVAEILKEKGFEYSSTSDRVREETVERGIKNYTIKQLQDIGNKLRNKFGNGILVKRTLNKITMSGKAVIDGVRNIGEIEELKKHRAIIIAVDAPLQTRYQRLIERARDSDPKDWEGFIEMDRRDKGVGEEKSGQQVLACIEKSDFKIENNGTIEELKRKVEAILSTINLNNKKTNIRPTWDEYFMEIMRAVSKRATCDRGKTACVIVRDKQILVTGYVGSPQGLPHCDEAGHQLETTLHLDCTEKDHCIRTIHAEQNAICQAAKLGTSIKGATAYCKMEPCAVCAKMLINCGIKKVVCEKRYQSGAQSLLESAGVNVEVLNQEIEKY